MALPNISMVDRGFTLIEILIAMGMYIGLLSIGLAVTMHDYRLHIVRAEEETLVALLESARSQAMNNINGTSHGVAINPPDYPHAYIVFEGEEYGVAVGEVITQQYALDIKEESLDVVVFEQLSGNAREPGRIMFIDSGGIEKEIEINAEGRIDW